MFFTNTGLANTDPTVNVGDEQVTLESAQMIMESAISAFLTEDELHAMLENQQEVSELINGDIITEASVVRLDKKARISQVQKVAVFSIAKEKNDKDFRRLMTVWRIERNLEKRLFDRYGNQGLRRAKATVQKNYRQKGQSFVKINDRTAKAINKTFTPNTAAPARKR